MAADGSIVIQAKIDDKQAQAELNRLNRKIENLNDQIEGKSRKRSYLIDQAQQIQAAYKDAIAKDQDLLAESLAKQYDRVQGSITRLDEQLRDHNTNVDIAKERYGELSAQVAGVGKAGEAAGKSAESGLARLEKRLVGLAKRVFVFSVFTKALRALRTYLAGVIQENADAAAAIDNLKNAFAGLVQPIVNAVIPAFVFFLNVVTNLINAIASLFSGLGAVSGGLGKEAKSLKGVGGAADKAGKSLASFDEINKLSDGSGGGGGGAGGEAPNFAAQIDPELASVGALFTGIALVALGAILTFSGTSIPLGIAMMVAGGLAIWGTVKENWGYITEMLTGKVGAATAVIATALLAIGAVLAFSGTAVPLGIGLMIAGAGGLAAVVAVNWSYIVDALQGPVGAVTAILGGALLVIGAILTFSGANIPLGIGLMVAGGLALGSVMAINWNALPEILAGVWESITTGVTTAWNAVVSFLAGVWEGIKTGAVGAWEAIKEAFVSAGVWFYNNVVFPISMFFHNLWAGITNAATSVWEGIKEVFATVGQWFEDTFTDAWEGIVSVFSVAGEIFTDIKDGVVEGFKTVVNEIIKGINKVVAIPFNALNTALQAIHDVNILGIKPFTFIHTISVPEIPLLAQGAVIPPNREFLAVLGDQKSGTNIETPLATMVQAFRTALAESGYGGSQEAVMVVDGEVFGRLAYKLGGKESTRVGVSLTGGGMA